MVDRNTGKLLTGFGWVDYNRYSVVPLAHPEDRGPSWRVDNSAHVLYVANDFSVAFAEKAIAEAQIEYATYISSD